MAHLELWCLLSLFFYFFLNDRLVTEVCFFWLDVFHSEEGTQAEGFVK